MAIAGAPAVFYLVSSWLAFTVWFLGKLTSDSHGLDAVKGLLTGGDLIIVVLMRESQLVQDLQLAPGILDGFESRHGVDIVVGEAWG